MKILQIIPANGWYAKFDKVFLHVVCFALVRCDEMEDEEVIPMLQDKSNIVPAAACDGFDCLEYHLDWHIVK